LDYRFRKPRLYQLSYGAIRYPGNYISKIKAWLKASIGLEPIITNLEVANNVAKISIANI
jgi:hypothetical protein